MSANHYDTCPKCKAGDPDNPEEGPFREDWDIGFFDGKFSIEYRGECSACGYVKTFEHKERNEP